MDDLNSNSIPCINNNNNNNNNNNEGGIMESHGIKIESDTQSANDSSAISNDAQNQSQSQSQNQNQAQSQIEENQREPDSDALKMFVGQIPRDWNESDCQKLLQQFGEVHSINVLRDKKTGKSRGCCFVTYYTRRSALEAQNALHNVKTLQGCHHPIQMKPADTENRNDRKLFIGMLSKNMNEQDVRKMFSPYGSIEECTILKDSNNQSKGCAFVTYSTRSSATQAIKALNHSVTLEGCTSSLVVKFADTQKDKEARRGHQSIINSLWTQAAAATSPLTSSLVNNSYLAALSTLMSSSALNQQQQQLSLTLPSPYTTAINNDFSLTATLNPVLAAALTQKPNHSSHMSHFHANKIDSIRDQLNGPLSGVVNPVVNVNAATYLSPQMNQFPTATIANGSAQKQMEGPEGANLFIYHLPPEFTDADLISIFSPYGNILSAKVFIDKNTNLSKCFGFVSYDNPISAQAAINAMHGFQIRNKRLKVQLKKTRDKPY